MISYLKGVLLEKQPPIVVIEVNGLGYEVLLPINSFYQLPQVGEEVVLHTHFSVREDGHSLYGFLVRNQRELFRLLIKISGVGPKLALAILSGIEANVFVRAVLDNRAEILEKLPGIGKKTALRLVMEMRDKLGDWELEGIALSGNKFSDEMHDAISALVALGYKPHDAQQALAAYKTSNLSSEELVRAALKAIK